MRAYSSHLVLFVSVSRPWVVVVLAAEYVVVFVVDLFLDLHGRFFCEGPVFEQEGEFFQCATIRLREHEIDEDVFKSQPGAISDEPSPGYVVQSNGVDEGGEKACAASEELEDGDALGALGEWEEFNEIGVSECVVADVVARRVGEDEEYGDFGGSGAFMGEELLHRDGPAHIAAE